jgi:hypothetical protein
MPVGDGIPFGSTSKNGGKEKPCGGERGEGRAEADGVLAALDCHRLI